MISKDALWKGIVEDFFEELMTFFYPKHIHLLDFTQIEFLDKEFSQLFPESEANDNVADKLVKVKRKSGGELWQLIHIEVQGYADKTFSERMFRYYYRTFDRYLLPLEALAVLTDPYPSYHPKLYQVASFKTQLTYQFHTYKLLEQERTALETDKNPFALVLLTALESLQINKNDESLFQLKLRLFRYMLNRGYDKTRIDRLTSFIKYYASFASPEMNRKFDQVTQKLTQSNEPMGIIETILYETRKEAKLEGMKEAQDKLKYEYVVKLLLNGLSSEQISNLLELPLVYVAEIEEKLKKEGKLSGN